MGLHKLIIIVILSAYLFVLLVGLFKKFVLKGWLKLLGPKDVKVRQELERRLLKKGR